MIHGGMCWGGRGAPFVLSGSCARGPVWCGSGRWVG